MPSGPTPESELVEKIWSGDQSACEQLVHQHYEAIYRFLLRLTNEPDVASDCTQDTFRAAWQKLSEFNGRSSLSTWLHRIAYHRFIDVYRKRRREELAHENLRAESARVEGVSIPCATTLKDTSDFLQAAVNRLPEDQRTIVALHYLGGLSLRETADVVGQAVGTVKWRLNKALNQLRVNVDAESVQ
jgi:RNA polymerase sigma-70 factor, ECF subfamily